MFSPSTSVSPANHHSTNFSTITITYHPGLIQQASSGRITKSPTPLIKKWWTDTFTSAYVFIAECRDDDFTCQCDTASESCSHTLGTAFGSSIRPHPCRRPSTQDAFHIYVSLSHDADVMNWYRD
jgi:hypothetical protein